MSGCDYRMNRGAAGKETRARRGGWGPGSLSSMGEIAQGTPMGGGGVGLRGAEHEEELRFVQVQFDLSINAKGRQRLYGPAAQKVAFDGSCGLVASTYMVPFVQVDEISQQESIKGLAERAEPWGILTLNGRSQNLRTLKRWSCRSEANQEWHSIL